jgi:hypothetical protein
MPAKKSALEVTTDMYLNALAFHVAAQALDALPDSQLVYWPMVTNEAFALELFLKCLHRVRRRRIKGHDVVKLFEKLGSNDRKTIRTNYNLIVATHPQAHKCIEAGVSLDLEDVLQRSRTTFTTVRYWHEGNTPSRDRNGYVSNAGTGSLSDAIRKLLLDLRPQWKLMATRVPALNSPLTVNPEVTKVLVIGSGTDR